MNPTKNNDDNFIDQIDDGDDSLHIDLEQEDDDLSCNRHDDKNHNDNEDHVLNDNVDIICSNENENDDNSNDEIQPESDNEENDNNLASIVENAEGSLEEEKMMNCMTMATLMTWKMSQIKWRKI